MCGIAGLWNGTHSKGALPPGEAIRRMTRALAHRGPDDEGYFEGASAGPVLGHRRLSIVDLSPLGHQPMHSESGRYVLIYNGEIYNHRRLRPELERAGHSFRGHSDTEVMLAAIEEWGLDQALGRFIGMFALALWDKQRQVLSLVRDRLGIKPLYYGWTSEGFVFGSELKAIESTPGFAARVDPDSLALLLRFNYIAAPYSIYRGIRKMMPGTVLEIDRQIVDARPNSGDIEKRCRTFWSAREVAQAGMAHPIASDATTAVNELETLLRDAVALRMEADVPLGAFLSGGIDSSTVVALMQAQSSRAVKTFSIGFHEEGYNEAPFARRVAAHLGTEHTELYVTPRETMDVVPLLPVMFDEPFSDSSQIPTYLVSKLARQSVTVSLSGDGGDELFGGYDRYFWARRVWNQMEPVPAPLRRAAAAALGASPALLGGLLGAAMRFLPRQLRVRNASNKAATLATLLNYERFEDVYAHLSTHWRDATEIVLGSKTLPIIRNQPGGAGMPGIFERMMLTDLVGYLPDDILTKVDRASMAVSLEARVPILDHRVVEYAWKLPLDLKVRGDCGKWILREVLNKYVPKHITDRKKMGFGVPIGAWLRGPLRDWAASLLDERRLKQQGYFNPKQIRAVFSDHLAGRADNHYYLWDVLMFEGWLEARPTLSTPTTAPGGGSL